MTIIGMKELRTNTQEITRRVQAGESFTVVSRSKPQFEIRPITQDSTRSVENAQVWARQFINNHRPAFKALANK